MTLLNDQGDVLAMVRGMRSTAASKRERVDQFGDRVKKQILGYEWRYGENLTEPKRLGAWLVIGSSSGIADDVVARLEHYGAFVAGKVRLGDCTLCHNTTFEVRSTEPSDWRHVLSKCGDLDGLVFVHGMDADEGDDPTGEHALAAIITCTQALLKQDLERKPRVYIVTRSAMALDGRDDEVQPRQSALNGFTRVAFNELDGLQFSSVDLPARIGLDTIDALTQELLCDDIYDEVALRGGMRFVSELADTRLLSEDRIEYRQLDDEHPVLVRPLLPESESIGTARILATDLRAIGSDEVQVRYEATIVPSSLLLDPGADSIDRPVLEFVGRVLAAGHNVQDFKAGMRICGFAPADLTSHVNAPRQIDLRC